MEEVLGIVAPVPKGEWSNLTAYEQLNIVRHNNTLYMAKQNVPASIEPTVSPNWTDYWMLLMSPLSATDIVEEVHPVESLYITANPTNPHTIFGGDWLQITDCFILAASDISKENPTYIGGATGGSKDAVVVSHRHYIFDLTEFVDGWNYTSTGTMNFSTARGQGSGMVIDLDALKDAGYIHQTADQILNTNGGYSYMNKTDIRGESGTDKNMPPYKAFYVWQRIA